MDIKGTIIRCERGDEGAFGMLLLNRKAFCVTLEPLYRDNIPNLSSIPTGRYVCKRTPSPLITTLTDGKWDTGFVLEHVQGRSGIMIHPGNTTDDTHGCILVAQYFGKLRGDRAILNSGATFNEFMTVTRTVDQFPLMIFDAIPFW